MAKTQVATRSDLFDYSDVPAVDARRCKAAYETIGKRQRRMAEDIVAIGKELIGVKARLPHGLFTPWLQHHFAWSDRTARRLMEVGAVFKTATLADLTIDQTALYLMAEDSCPDDVRKQVLKQAKGGSVVTPVTVKEAIREFNRAQSDEEEEEQDEADAEPEDVEVTDGAVVRTVTGERVDELLEWSLPGFITTIRREVQQWAAVCPDEQHEEIVEVLRDIANQVEKAWKDEE
jgi:hypothetical protein